MANTIQVTLYTPQQLSKEHGEHEAYIKRIMQEVGQEYDNIKNPSVPLWQQLEVTK